MYLPRYHRLDDTRVIQALITEHPLATWVCVVDGEPVVNHIPFHLAADQGPHGRLIGHVSRANAIWRALPSAAAGDQTAAASPGRSIAVFHGPQAYITPAWYPGKAEHGMVVPTWNYAVVHVHGVARAIEDPAWIRTMLERLTAQQEAERPAPWRVDDAPAAWIDRMLGAIVGIEIAIERLEGKLKVSQDEAPADRRGTVAGLRQRADGAARRMADLVEGQIDNAPEPAVKDATVARQ